MNMRVAFYYAPAEDDPLWDRAAHWLGRDPVSDRAYPQPDLPDIQGVTEDARHYAFHATLKPPMRLRAGVTWEDVQATAHDIAAGIAPFTLPRLAVSNLHGFLALRETAPSVELQALADACVAGADHLREPPSAEELAKRRRNGLPPAQDANLARWGYPYVFATWYFHMTLTKRLDEAGHAIYRPAAEAHFAEAVKVERRVSELSLFTQRNGGPFTLAARIPLRG